MTTLLVHGAAAWLGPGRVVEDGAVVIEGERIAWVGPAGQAPPADQEAAGDWFLMPGVVDQHVHLGLSDPRQVLHGGVTSVRDLGWPPRDIFPLVDISTGTDFDGPAVAAAGPMVTCAGGYPSRAPWAPPGTAVEVRGAEEAADAVARIAELDPAVIKVTLNSDAGPTLTDAELLAVVGAAHDRRLRVTAHVQGRGQTERALGAGVDELAHAPWTERLGDDLIAGMARSVQVVSTLDIHSYGRSTPELATASDNVRRFHEAGGRVRYGTDLGNGPIPPGIHAREAQHLAAGGLTVHEVLVSMTARPLEEGTHADVVGLAGSPLDELDALDRPRVVVRAGRVARLDR